MQSTDWTDELREEIVKEYTGLNPTPENTLDIVKDLAIKHNKSTNAVRMILSKKGVYITKGKVAVAKTEGTGAKRVSKADSIASLRAAIVAADKEVDEDILNRLTGKAAVYFESLLG